MKEPSVHLVDDLKMTFQSEAWGYETRYADAISGAWRAWREATPGLFDGRVMILAEGRLEGSSFRGTYVETGYSAFLHYLRGEREIDGARNAFSLAALTGSDGALVMGEMAAGTANAGKIYFPGGTPDRSDLVGEEIDLAGSARRELAEETGLSPADFVEEPGFVLVEAPLRLAFLKIFRSRLPAVELAETIRANLAAQRERELADVHVLAVPEDLAGRNVPPFQAAYVRWWFARMSRG